jgi:broad specificity phosphatase PhoE
MVRHAEVRNVKDILYGRLPRFGISELGRTQAEETARFLAGRRIQAIYTSPLLRARQTAQIISRYHVGQRVRIARALIEVRTSYQGQPNSVIKPGFSFYDPMRSSDDETMAEIFSRVLGFLRIVARRHAGGAVVAVSHADPIAIMRLGLLGQEFINANLHGTVYPMRSSATQVALHPGGHPELIYFNVAGAMT